jgi:hypothetical protein
MSARNTIRKIGKQVISFADDGQPQLVDTDERGEDVRSQPRARGPPSLLTVGEAAAILRCSVASLNRWRLTGEGPKFVYVGRRVRYEHTALADFIAASTRNSTSDPGEPAAATAA